MSRARAPGPYAQKETIRWQNDWAPAADIAGRKREYETTYILRPDVSNDAISAVNTKIRGLIEAGGGNLLKVENWGRRKLAYEVKKHLKGVYLFFNYLGPAGLVEEVERNLRLSDRSSATTR